MTPIYGITIDAKLGSCPVQAYRLGDGSVVLDLNGYEPDDPLTFTRDDAVTVARMLLAAAEVGND